MDEHVCLECRIHPIGGVLHVLSSPYPPEDEERAFVATYNEKRAHERWYAGQLKKLPLLSEVDQ